LPVIRVKPNTITYQFHNPQIMPYVTCFCLNRVYSCFNRINLRGMNEKTLRLLKHQRALQQHNFHINSFTHDSVSSLLLFCSSTHIFFHTFIFMAWKQIASRKKSKRETVAKFSSSPGSENASEKNNTSNILLCNCYRVYSHRCVWGVKRSA
jgi:hypothetical protein